jgi:hypothetical protein
MPEKSTVLQVIASGIVVVLAACLFLFLPLRTSTPLNIYRSHETNGATAGPVDFLIVSNTTGFELRLWRFPLQTNSPGGWHGGPFRAAYMMGLPAHSACKFILSSGPSHATWRAPVGWDYDPLNSVEFARRFVMDNIQLNLRLLSQGQMPGMDGGNHAKIHVTYSPEFKD